MTANGGSGALHQFIDGRRVPSRSPDAGRLEVLDPSTGEQVEVGELAGPADVDAAVDAEVGDVRAVLGAVAGHAVTGRCSP